MDRPGADPVDEIALQNLHHLTSRPPLGEVPLSVKVDHFGHCVSREPPTGFKLFRGRIPALQPCRQYFLGLDPRIVKRDPAIGSDRVFAES
jgi:hypothetical protein